MRLKFDACASSSHGASLSFVTSTVLPSLADAKREVERLATSLKVLYDLIEERERAKYEDGNEDDPGHDQRLTEKAIRGLKQVVSNFTEEINVVDGRLRQEAYPVFPTLFQPLLPSIPVLINEEEEEEQTDRVVNNQNGIRIAYSILEADDGDEELGTASASTSNPHPPLTQSKSKPELIVVSSKKAALHSVHRKRSEIISASGSAQPSAGTATLPEAETPSHVPSASSSRAATANASATPTPVFLTPIRISTSETSDGDSNDGDEVVNLITNFSSDSDDGLECLNAPLPIEIDVQKFFEQGEDQKELEERLTENKTGRAAVASTSEPTTRSASMELAAAVEPQPTTSKSLPMPVSIRSEPQPVVFGAAQTATSTTPAAPTPEPLQAVPNDPLKDPKLSPNDAYVRIKKLSKAIENQLEDSGGGLWRGRLTVSDCDETEGQSQSLLQPPLEDEDEEARDLRLLRAAIHSLKYDSKIKEKTNNEARPRAMRRGAGVRRRRRPGINSLEEDESDLAESEEGSEEFALIRQLPNVTAAASVDGLSSAQAQASTNHENEEDMDVDGSQGSVLDLRPSTNASECENSDSEEEARRKLLGLDKSTTAAENENKSSEDEDKPSANSNADGNASTSTSTAKKRPHVRALPLPALARLSVLSSSSEEEDEPSTSLRRYPKRKPTVPAPVSTSTSAFSSSTSNPVSSDPTPSQPQHTTRPHLRVKVINTDDSSSDDDGSGPSSRIVPPTSARRQRYISSADSSIDTASLDGEDSSISDGSSDIEWITLGHEFPKPIVMTPQIKREIRDLDDDDDEDVVEVAVPTRLRSSKNSDAAIAGPSKSRSVIDLSLSPVKPAAVAVTTLVPKSREPKSKGRRDILPIIPDEELRLETRRAGQEEEARKKRKEERDRLILAMPPVPGFVLDPQPETAVEVANGIAKYLKPHQKEGIKFMWDACFESQALALDHTTNGGGCILAHSMGLGKTLQVIALLHTILRNSALGAKFKRVLVVCPKVVVRNWRDEVKLWHHNILSTETVPLFVLSKGDKKDRADQLQQWRQQGGIGLVHYEMLKALIPPEKNSAKKAGAGAANANGAAAASSTMMEAEPGTDADAASTEPVSPLHEERALYEECLRQPGPEVVVLDEGHRLKNRDTKNYKVIASIKTQRKIILTGTPLQNNLREFYVMMNLIKPDLLGTLAEFTNRFINPIENGQFKDSLPEDVDRMRERVYVLTQLVSGCVHRRSAAVLTEQLEPKLEYTIGVNLTPEQATLYNACLSNRPIEDASTNKGLIGSWHSLSKIIAHPNILTRPNRKQATEQRRRRKARQESRSLVHLGDEDHDDEHSDTSSEELARLEKNWYYKIMNGSPPDRTPVVNVKSHVISAKLRVLRTILEICECTGEKVLVFSQFLTSLDQIEALLEEMHHEHEKDVGPHVHALEDNGQGPRQGSWRLGLDYLRLDGSSRPQDREKSIEAVNAPGSRIKAFLLCTLAGSLGINLIGANRVVVFDVSWNPSNDLQAIHRVYRYGQKRTCYVYRLVAQHTMEEKVYNGQIIKLSLAQRVVDEKSTERTIAKTHETVNSLYEPYPAQAHPPRPPVPPDAHLLEADRVLSKLVADHPNLIHCIREHKSFLQDDENLTEEQRRNAMAGYEKDKNKPRVFTRSQSNTNPGGRGAGGASTSGSPAKGRQPRAGGPGPGRPRKTQQGRNPIPMPIWKKVYFNLTQLHPTDTAKCLSCVNELQQNITTVGMYYQKAKDTAQDPVNRRLDYDKFQELKRNLQQRLEAINVHYDLNLIFSSINLDL